MTWKKRKNFMPRWKKEHVTGIIGGLKCLEPAERQKTNDDDDDDDDDDDLIMYYCSQRHSYTLFTSILSKFYCYSTTSTRWTTVGTKYFGWSAISHHSQKHSSTYIALPAIRPCQLLSSSTRILGNTRQLIKQYMLGIETLVALINNCMRKQVKA